MKRLFLFLLFLVLASQAFAQSGDPNDVNYRSITKTINGTDRVTLKWLWDKDANNATLASITRANIYTSGFYSLWIKGTTVGGGTDSLTVDCFELGIDGTVADQDSTIVTTRFDWTSASWHGPFRFTLNPAAGVGCKFSQEGVSDADTASYVFGLFH